MSIYNEKGNEYKVKTTKNTSNNNKLATVIISKITKDQISF